MIKQLSIAALTMIVVVNGTAAQPAEAVLGDVYLGDESAPILVEEYASLSCASCATFSQEVFPRIQAEYIETGKVRYVLKPFPADAVAAGAFVLARCGADADFYPIVDALFVQQDAWVAAEDKRSGLLTALTPFGFDDQKFDACLENTAAVHWIVATQERAVSDLDLQSTPTFVIDGVKHTGTMSFEAFSALVDPLVE